jgi:hypothetical protein
MRVGESFLTRVAFIAGPPPTKVSIGDEAWDRLASTFSVSAEEAARTLAPKLRKMLLAWRFQGHLEFRPGGLVVNVAELRPVPADYERLWQFLGALVNAALASG